jgi:hypothetical protein
MGIFTQSFVCQYSVIQQKEISIFFRIHGTMTTSFWKGKSCTCFIVINFSLFYSLFGFIERLWQEKSYKVSENTQWMSTDARERAFGMQQTGCSIRETRLWTHPRSILLTMTQVTVAWNSSLMHLWLRFNCRATYIYFLMN